jgi:hypothetical protein
MILNVHVGMESSDLIKFIKINPLSLKHQIVFKI